MEGLTYPKHLPQNLYKKTVILAVKALPMILVVAGVGLRCVKIYPVAQMVWTVEKQYSLARSTPTTIQCTNGVDC